MRDTGRRRGGAARRSARAAHTIAFSRFIERRIPRLELLDEEALGLIEDRAELVLEEIGIRFADNPPALALWQEAGADVKEDRVRIPRGLARKLCAGAPSEFTQIARNPERSVKIGGNATVFAPVYGPPFVHDIEGGRRYGTMEDFTNFVKLVYMSPGLHHGGGTLCEPVDIAVADRHRDMLYAHMRYSDKPFMGSVTAPSRAADTLAMCEILFGKEVVAQNVVTTSLVNLNSPLVMDSAMAGALEVYARAGQACIISPFIIGGAMSPVSVAGTLVQILAEVMAVIAYAQLLRKGAPMIFGAFVASIDMNSGAPTFGTPEAAETLLCCAQLARRMNLPFRSGGSLCGAKLPDAQAAYESAQTLLPALLAGVNFVLHAAGWLEGGLASSYEKLVLDADQLGAMQRMAEGVTVNDDTLAIDAMREVGPGGHYLGCAHTQAHFKDAFWRSSIFDYRPFETWKEDGAPDSMRLAAKRWRDMLSHYEAPPLDEGIDEGLQDFLARNRSAEAGAP